MTFWKFILKENERIRFVQFVPNWNVDSRANSQWFFYCLNEKVIDSFATSVYSRGFSKLLSIYCLLDNIMNIDRLPLIFPKITYIHVQGTPMSICWCIWHYLYKLLIFLMNKLITRSLNHLADTYPGHLLYSAARHPALCYNDKSPWMTFWAVWIYIFSG